MGFILLTFQDSQEQEQNLSKLFTEFLFTQLSPVITSNITTAHYQNQETDIGTMFLS